MGSTKNPASSLGPSSAASTKPIVPVNPNLFVITGGPGAGKTTLLRELERRGFCCVPEIAREIIREQVAANGDALPWANTLRYTQLMLARSVDCYRQHTLASRLTFIDRGIPDVLCYAQIINLEATSDIQSACETYRYNPTVFIAPPWQEIYSTDEERKETFADAVKVYERMVEVYRHCGYDLVVLPRVNPEQRAEFVLATLASLASASVLDKESHG
jgi:predicted ATPase